MDQIANDRDLKRRIRKVPGVPIMSVARGKYVIERLPGKLLNMTLHTITLDCVSRTKLADHIVSDAPEK
jgi:hypothetical protein